MNNNNNKNTSKETTYTVNSNVSPLVISAVGILFAVLVLLAFFSIFWWHYIRPQRPRGSSTRTTGRHVSSGGVQEEILNKIPIVPYRSNHEESEEALTTECTICLGEFEDGELLRVLPPCNHAFHVPCIDVWFMEHKNCPVCRSPITCDCDQSTPPITDSEDASIPSDRHHHNQLMDDDDDVSGSGNSRYDLESHLALHRHSHSVSGLEKRNLRGLELGTGLKRSLSMDQSSLYVTVNIQRDYDREEACTSSRSSSTIDKGVTMSRHCKSRSLRHLDHMSKVLIRSFSQLRNSGSGRSCGILSGSV